MNRFSVALSALLANLVATPVSADFRVLQEATKTVGVEDSTTYTISIVSDEPRRIIFGVHARFEGLMGQVTPLGMATPFSDLDGFFGNSDVSQDSRFLFHSSDFQPSPTNVSESGELLTASITNLPHATRGNGLLVRLAQIAQHDSQLGTPEQVRYTFTLDISDPLGPPIHKPILTGLVGVPEPQTATILLVIIGWLPHSRQLRRA